MCTPISENIIHIKSQHEYGMCYKFDRNSIGTLECPVMRPRNSASSGLFKVFISNIMACLNKIPDLILHCPSDTLLERISADVQMLYLFFLLWLL